MPIDVKTPNSPGWWLQKLAKKRDERLPRLTRLYSYFEGNPPLPEGARNMRKTYQEIQKTARTNFAETIVTSVSDRCSVRTVRTAAASDFDGDEEAVRIWRENNLDIEFSDVIEKMLSLGDGYMMVGLDPEDGDSVVITGEDPRQVVTIHDPVRQSEVRAGLKVFHDNDLEKDYFYVFLRGQRVELEDGTFEWTNARRYVASRPRKSSNASIRFSASGFEWDADMGGEEGEELNHRYVPIVRFRNRNGIGEFEHHTDTLDRINHGILQRMVIAMYQAFRLRAIQVDDEDAPDTDPETGEKIDYDDLLSADPGAFLKIPFNAKMWEGAQADMQGILASVKDDLLHLMEVTKTPLPAISDSVQQSAEGAANIKEGNAFKTERTQKRAAASLSLVFMIAFLCLEDSRRSERGAIRVDYFPAGRYSLSEKFDAFSKSVDLPLETRMAEILQFTPEQIAVAKSQLIEQQLTGVLNDPEPAATPATPAA